MGPDSRRRRRGDRRNKLIEEYSKPSVYDTGNDRVLFEEEHTTPRSLLFDQVTKLSGIECRLTTSLRAGYKGWNTASGIMFTIQPLKEIELVTLEFPTFENFGSSSSSPSKARKVQVYYREGTFSGVMNDSSAWTVLADTSAQLISPLPPPDTTNPSGLDMGAIVPANDFKSISLKAGQIYSIYIAGDVSSSSPKETLLKVKPADNLVGDVYIENDSLQVQTGVRLKGSSFPTMFDEPADFNGVLHYRANKSCTDSTLITTTEVVLEFAVNEDPTSQVMGSLRNAVQSTLSEWISTNENLSRYSKEDMLKLEGIGTNFRGRDQEKCPIDFFNCAVIATTLTFKHSHNLDHGKLEMEILGQSKELDGLVYSHMNPIESSYVSIPLSKAEFAITLTGVPTGEELNDIQRRYFEDVTVNFLRKSTTTKVFDAKVTNDVPETTFVEDGEQPLSRNLLSFFDFTTSITEFRMPMLRRKRKLQGAAVISGEIQIITEITAEGSVPELRNTVLEGIGNNRIEYTMELISQQMRPAEINGNDNGDYFAGLMNVEVKPHVSKDGISTPGGGNGIPTSTPIGSGGSVWAIVCILLIVFSLLWIFFRIYRDCFFSPFQKPVKLNNDNDEFKDEEEESLKNGTIKKSIFGRFKEPSESRSASDSCVTPNQDDHSESSFKPGLLTRALSFSSLMGGAKQKDNGDVALKPPKRKSSNKSMADTADDWDDLSCSSADVESSDDESVQKSAPRRTLSGPKRGRLKPSKSMPVQKRNSPTTEIKKQKKLTATKSMPVQKRNRDEPTTDVKKQKKATKKHGNSNNAKKTPPRTLSGPKRGKLTASKSMPVEKRNLKRTKSMPPASQTKETTKTDNSDKLQKHAPRRSPSAPKRGKLIPSKSMPVQKRNLKRTTSMPVGQTKKNSRKITSSESPASSKKNKKDALGSAKSEHTRKKKSASKNSKEIRQSRSWHAESLAESSKKKKAAEKERGVKPSKSMPNQKKKKKKTMLKPASESSVARLADMMHDTSDSEHDDSDCSSEGNSSSEGTNMADIVEQIRRKSSWKSETSPKRSSSTKSYGKAGKIQFGGLSNVSE